MASLEQVLNTLNTPFAVPYPTLAHATIPFVLTIPFWLTFYAGLDRYNDYVQSSDWRDQAPDATEIFDFVIVGGGSSGSVLANRLSENYTVLLLELGGDPNPFSRLGLSFYYLQRVPGTDLLYETEPQKNAALSMYNQRVFWPRGTGIGGSSNLNAMIYQRGNPNDYDNWANITGEDAWSFRNVLPYFKKLEDYEGAFPNDKLHGKGGPIHVETMRHRYTDKYALDAAREKGYRIHDLSGIQSAGFAPNEVTTKDALRWSTYQGYIKPILDRKNLRIYRYSRVVKVHLNKKRHAYGVTYWRHGQQRLVRARKEIILSAGAIDTPKILMLSGIGPKEHLRSVGIKTIIDLPVGQNLQDHVFTLAGPFRFDAPDSILFKRVIRLRSLFQFATDRRGILASTTHSTIGYAASSVRNYDESWPDIQFTFSDFGLMRGLPELLQQVFNVKGDIIRKYFKEDRDPDGEERETDGSFVGVSAQRPKGRGYIKLASRNPLAPPIMQPNYHTHPDDVKAIVEGMRIIVDLFENTTTYRKINARFTKPFPGCESVPFKSDAYYECHMRQMTFTVYHPVGTASMGKGPEDRGAVVDPQLRVLKTTGLRVVDASIMPVIPNANTNIPSIMVGEVGSDFIRNYWNKRRRE